MSGVRDALLRNGEGSSFMSVNVCTKRVGGVLVASLQGDLDDHSADAVRKALDRELDTMTPPRLVLDLEGVTFMDSSGLGVILGRYRKVSERGGQMRIASVPAQLHKLFAISGLHKVMPIHAKQGEAVRALKEVSQ